MTLDEGVTNTKQQSEGETESRKRERQTKAEKTKDNWWLTRRKRFPCQVCKVLTHSFGVSTPLHSTQLHSTPLQLHNGKNKKTPSQIAAPHDIPSFLPSFLHSFLPHLLTPPYSTSPSPPPSSTTTRHPKHRVATCYIHTYPRVLLLSTPQLSRPRRMTTGNKNQESSLLLPTNTSSCFGNSSGDPNWRMQQLPRICSHQESPFLTLYMSGCDEAPLPCWSLARDISSTCI